MDDGVCTLQLVPYQPPPKKISLGSLNSGKLKLGIMLMKAHSTSFLWKLQCESCVTEEKLIHLTM